MAGKGSKPRPIGDYRNFLSEFDRIFNKTTPPASLKPRHGVFKPKTGQDSGTVFVGDSDHDKDDRIL